MADEYDYDDYEDGDYGDEGYEEEERIDYLGEVRKLLPKGHRMADEAILAQLEVHDFSIKDTAKAIQKQIEKAKQKPGSQPAKGQPPGKAAPTKPGQKPPTPAAAAAAAAASTAKAAVVTAAPNHSSAPSLKPETVFAKAAQQLEAHTVDGLTIDDLSLSDTETSISTPDPTHKSNLTMVVVGHVDAGKSTLVGHLAHLLGQVSTRQINKFDKESRTLGKASFAYAWVTDERQSEREHGVTIDIAERKMESSRFTFTLLDSPGHRDFVPNMIKGAALADVALLVVPATAGEFESALSSSAQTREHAVLLKALGVGQVIVVVNKMDHTQPAPWSAERYSVIEVTMRALLSELQFADAAVQVVPVSGLGGDNLVHLGDEHPLHAWYSGPSLLQALDAFHCPPRCADKPLRARAVDASDPTAHGVFQTTVLQGALGVGRTVGVAKCSTGRVHLFSARVGAIFESTPSAKRASDLLAAGGRDLVFVQLLGDKSRPLALQLEGDEELILFKGAKPRVATSFHATIHTLPTLAMPIIPGASFELYIKGQEMQCKVTQIHGVVGSSSKRPKCVGSDKNAHVTVEVLGGEVLVDSFALCRALGRFALRSKGVTVAVGVVEESHIQG